MSITNPTKAFLALVTICAITFLMALGRITTEAGLGVLGTIVGYVVGNGIGSKAGTISPVISLKRAGEILNEKEEGHS
jgi:hypothetical protein